MSRIYRQARAIFADVGEKSEGKELIPPLLESIIDAGDTCEAIEMSLEGSSHNDPAEIASLGAFMNEMVEATGRETLLLRRQASDEVKFEAVAPKLEHHGLPSSQDKGWTAFQQFFASPYWQRIWVLQEFALAPKISILYGDLQIRPSKLIDAMKLLFRFGNWPIEMYFGHFKDEDEAMRFGNLGYKGFITLMNEKDLVRNPPSDTDATGWLITKLESSKFHMSTDPRDRIYALLGLASDGEDYIDAVTYSPDSNHEAVFRCFAKMFIERGHGMKLLYQAGACSDWSKSPSWVPVSLNPWLVFCDCLSSSLMSCKSVRVHYLVIKLESLSTPEVQIPSSRLTFLQDWQKEDRSLNQIAMLFEHSTFAASPSSDSSIHVRHDNDSLLVRGSTVDKIAKKTAALGSDPLLSVKFAQGAAYNFVKVLDFFSSGIFLALELDGYPTNERGLDVALRTFLRGPPSGMTQDQMISMQGGIQAFFSRVRLGQELSEMKEDEKSDLETIRTRAEEQEQQLVGLLRAGGLSANQRCFCTTEKGFFGLVPGKVEVGDEVAVFNGGNVPFILRRLEAGNEQQECQFRLVGDGYFHGLMHGEVLSLDTYHERDLVIV